MNKSTRFALQRNDLLLQRRHRKARIFANFCCSVTWLGAFLLMVLLYQIAIDGLAWVDWQFLTSFPSRFPYKRH